VRINKKMSLPFFGVPSERFKICYFATSSSIFPLRLMKAMCLAHNIRLQTYSEDTYDSLFEEIMEKNLNAIIRSCDTEHFIENENNVDFLISWKTMDEEWPYVHWAHLIVKHLNPDNFSPFIYWHIRITFYEETVFPNN
jgi:hypothetical protein